GPASAKWMNACVDACGPVRVDELPDIDVAGRRVVTRDVAEPVAIDIPDGSRRPPGWMRAGIEARVPLSVRDLPDVDVARCGIVPGDVAVAVVIEVTDTGRHPTERM